MGRYSFAISVPAGGTKRMIAPLGYMRAEPGNKIVLCKPGKIPNVNFRINGVAYD